MADRPTREPDQKAARRKAAAHYQDLLGRKVSQRLKAQSENKDNLLFGLGLFGVVGWSVAIPTLIGVAVGLWLDARYSGPYSWTLMLLVLGVLLGCLNAWYWIRQEGGS